LLVSVLSRIPNDVPPPIPAVGSYCLCRDVKRAVLAEGTRCRGLGRSRLLVMLSRAKANFKRLEASILDFRQLCPGPMVEGAAVGVERLRVVIDRLPVQTPAAVKWLPDWLLVPIFASRVAEMIVPYADTAALMLPSVMRG
jgi:uncharacterized protein